MELTHKLIRADIDNPILEKGSLDIGTTENPTLQTNGNYWTSKPINIKAGDEISIITYLPLHHITGGLIDVDRRGFQCILTCDEYSVDEECTTRAVSRDDKELISYTAEEDCVVVIGCEFGDDLVNARCAIKRKNEEYIIDEPIGFDGLQMHIERHNYHGMGAESSLDTLEFYEKAYEVVRNAYNENIDARVLYVINSGEDLVYSGQIDLTTCSFSDKEYPSVKAKIGEIGSLTTFNNHTSTDVDLNSAHTINGIRMEDPVWRSLHVPMKHLLYTNKMREKNTRVADSRQSWGNGDEDPSRNPIEGDIVLTDVLVNEFGSVSSDGILFAKDEDFDEKYGADTISILDWSMSFRISWDSFMSYGSYSVYGEVYLYSGETLIGRARFDMLANSASTKSLATVIAPTNFPTDTLHLKYKLWQTGDNNNKRVYFGLKLEVLGGSYLHMKMYDTLQETDPVYANMIIVYDALRHVTKSISNDELDVKSDWYKYNLNTFGHPCGNGACKALTNGYKIRGLFTNGEYERNMPLSFKSLIESLDAMDCIGWGFSTELENNVPVTCIRVERWDWFYNDTTILTLTDVAEVNTDIYTDRIPTELKIGYKKYATQEQYNSIDSPHGSRTFVSGIKALTNAVTKESDFIADNYAIEEIRRAKTKLSETEESTYDENIFVFELTLGAATAGGFSIDNTAYEATNIGRAEEFINAKLTPRHMAARWRAYLFSTNNKTPFRFTTGEINYNSSFRVIPTYSASTLLRSLEADDGVESVMREDKDLAFEHAKFQAEKITFSCPISVEQYNAVKANPYGLVSVNGVLGWIIDFKYSFADGMADFTLIAKYVPQNN